MHRRAEAKKKRKQHDTALDLENIPDIPEELPFLPEGMEQEERSRAGLLETPLQEYVLWQEPSETRKEWKEERRREETDPPSDDDAFPAERKYIILVIYDIISNKQRVKMAKLLSGYGSRVQKSAFEARLNRKQYAKLLADIKKMLRTEDNVRIYKLHSYEEIVTFGDREYDTFEDVIII